ncbi:hypothetical protein D3C80_649800 [compost metagenome]
MAGDALALAQEQVHTLDLLGIECLGVALQVVVQRGLVGNQGGFVELDRQAEEQREIGFHLGVRRTTQGHRLGGIPQARIEGRLDQVAVGRPARAGHRAEHRVGGRDALVAEHQGIEHALADVGKGAPAAGHLHCAAGWPHGLGRGRGVVEGQADLGCDRRLVGRGDEDAGIRVAVAEGRETVEHEIGPAVPEVAQVEHRVDHRRRVAPGTAPHVDATDLEDAVGLLCALVEARLLGPNVVGIEHALGADHIVRGIEDRRIAVQRVGQHVGGEIGFLQGVVGATLAPGEGRIRGHIAGNTGGRERLVEDRGHVGIGVGLPRVDLVVLAVVGAGVEVARRAGGIAIAADVHVPEQGLAQAHGRGAVDDVVGHQVDLAPAFGAGGVGRQHAAQGLQGGDFQRRVFDGRFFGFGRFRGLGRLGLRFGGGKGRAGGQNCYHQAASNCTGQAERTKKVQGFNHDDALDCKSDCRGSGCPCAGGAPG